MAAMGRRGQGDILFKGGGGVMEGNIFGQKTNKTVLQGGEVPQRTIFPTSTKEREDRGRWKTYRSQNKVGGGNIPVL